MPYSKFTSVVKFCQQYHLQINDGCRIFANQALLFEPSASVLQDIEDAKSMPMSTEKAKSEWIIGPILKEIKRKNPFISVFSGFSLNIDGEVDLQGNPDYILSARPIVVEVTAPIFCLMESKNKTPDEGFAQCVAEMYAARLFNKQTNEPIETIYGAVTNAYDWVFLKLAGDTIFIDKDRYYLNNMQELLGVLQFITNQYKMIGGDLN